MPKYKVLKPVLISGLEDISLPQSEKRDADVVDQSQMIPATDESPSEWDSLVGTGHIELIQE